MASDLEVPVSQVSVVTAGSMDDLTENNALTQLQVRLIDTSLSLLFLYYGLDTGNVAVIKAGFDQSMIILFDQRTATI